MNIIETRKLTHRYGSQEAVRELDLSVPAGSVFALLGPNGAGKTTTIKLLLGLLAPAAGEARVFGVNSQDLRARELAQLGFVAENQALPLWMTVRQLLDYYRPFYATWDRALEKALLARLELPEQRKLGEMSRGMQRKAALVSSLAYRPRLLILDEPLSGLDPVMREEFVRGVLETSALGDWTMLLSSHDMEDVERLADHVGFLKSGRLTSSETTDTLQQRFRRVELTDAAVGAAAPAGALEWESAGNLTRFIATDYAGDATDRDWRQRYPGAALKVQPLSLREIFITLNRSAPPTSTTNSS